MNTKTRAITPVELPGLSLPAKPFLKWAGGKGQLIKQMTQFFPPELRAGRLHRYVEPFVGGGAMFFHVAQSYALDEFYVSDVNEDLVLAYRTLQEDVDGLIALLAAIEAHYFRLSPDKQKSFFYEIRRKFNDCRPDINSVDFRPAWIERAAQIVFLNRTCFNGLFRVNSKGEFNVPFGDYKNPRICDRENLKAASRVLQRVTIRCADFVACQEYVDVTTFVYFDPPYRPISKTASFTSYSRHEFNDEAQARLANLYRTLDAKGARLLLSNSDPKNENPDDDFFEKLYRGFHVNRVSATRMINCDANKRGPIKELLITNYSVDESTAAVKRNGRRQTLHG